jgi:ribosomal protein S18 acetylase RimI-like enzyme
MSLIIRNAVTVEFDEIASLAVESYREYAQNLAPEHWDTMSSSLLKVSEIAQHAQWIVVEQTQQLVGSVVYYRPGTSNSRLFQAEWASFRMLSVLPSYRGKGIGRQLSLECIERAKQDKAEIISLHTSELMYSARQMYEHLGFEQDIELPRSLGIRYWRYILRLK